MKNIVPIRIFQRVENGFEIYTIQVMQQRYKSDFMGMLETIGYITYQRGISEENWYGMRFVADTNEFSVFNNFHKLCRKIHSFVGSATQPSELISFINGREYFLLNNELFSYNDTGLYCFNVMENEKLYARLIAYDLDDANIKLNNLKKKYRKTTFNTLSTMYPNTLSIGKSFRIEKP